MPRLPADRHSEDAPALRIDAERNRRRILAAARQVFLESGLDAPMIAIARRAQVGTATVYRRFPTRDALVAEVFEDEVRTCIDVVVEASQDTDAWRGFATAIEKLLRLDTLNRGLVRDFFAAHGRALEISAPRRRAEAAFDDLVRRAKRSGALRADFKRSDLELVLLANGGLEATRPEAREAASRRFVSLVLDAFAAPSGDAPDDVAPDARTTGKTEHQHSPPDPLVGRAGTVDRDG